MKHDTIAIALLAMATAAAHADSAGTGFFVSDRGHVLTNHHVIDGADAVEVLYDEELVEAEVVASSPKWDIALLKVPLEETPFVRVADSEEVGLGDEVFTIGFPMVDRQGVSPKFSKGNIASTKGIDDDPDQFQISVPVQPGNSGGGLFNEEGEVVGLVFATINKLKALVEDGIIPENVNYALKANRVQPFLSFIESPLPEEDLDYGSPIERAENASILILVPSREDAPDAEVTRMNPEPPLNREPAKVVMTPRLQAVVTALQYLEAGESGIDDADQSSFYTDPVDYFDSGWISRREAIEQEREYEAKWTFRRHQVTADPRVSELGGPRFAVEVDGLMAVSTAGERKRIEVTTEFVVNTSGPVLIESVQNGRNISKVISSDEFRRLVEKIETATGAGEKSANGTSDVKKAAYEVVYRGRDGVSLRLEPDASSPKLASLYSGAPVYGTGRRSGRWVEVVAEGWMALHGSVTRFLVEESPSQWVVQKTSDGRLAMRAEADSKSFKIGDFLTGVSVSGSVREQSGGQTWIRVRRAGWMADRGESGRSFLKVR